MLRTASLLFLPVALAAAVSAGCATPAAAGHTGSSSRPELRAARILDRHRARREFPGAVLALRDPSGPSFTVTAGTADPSPGGAQVDPPADLRSRAHKDVRGDHRAGVHVGADVDVRRRHHHDAFRDIGAVTHRAAPEL